MRRHLPKAIWEATKKSTAVLCYPFHATIAPLFDKTATTSGLLLCFFFFYLHLLLPSFVTTKRKQIGYWFNTVLRRFLASWSKISDKQVTKGRFNVSVKQPTSCVLTFPNVVKKKSNNRIFHWHNVLKLIINLYDRLYLSINVLMYFCVVEPGRLS